MITVWPVRVKKCSMKPQTQKYTGWGIQSSPVICWTVKIKPELGCVRGPELTPPNPKML